MTTRTLKTSWALEAPQLLLLLAMFALAIGTWDAAPDQIPMHWDERGQVDRFGGKAEGLFLLPLVALGRVGCLGATHRSRFSAHESQAIYAGRWRVFAV